MRQRRSSITSTEDDVRSSLDVLDQVIDEFDFETEADEDNERATTDSGRGQSRGRRRHRPPPKQTHPVKNKINAQIDDIFSELTQEIYTDEKFLLRRRQQQRKVDDPLPVPPPLHQQKRLIPKDEVIVYGHEEESARDSQDRRTALKSVKAQVHSMENKREAEENRNRRKFTNNRHSSSSPRKSSFTTSSPVGVGAKKLKSNEYRRSRSLGPLENENQMKRHHVPKPLVNRPPPAAQAQATIEKMLPRYPQKQPLPPEPPRHLRAQGRQKSMIDLREKKHQQQIRNRRSVAVDPFEEISPLLQQQVLSASSSPLPYFGEGQINGFLGSVLSGSGGGGGSVLSAGSCLNRNLHPQQQQQQQQQQQPASNFPRHLTLDAQREYLIRNAGFSSSHPFISGEVPIHPELQGRLPFNVPSRTIPLRPEDYDRFQPERWILPPPAKQKFQGDPELRRRREIHRHNSQHHLHSPQGGPTLPPLPPLPQPHPPLPPPPPPSEKPIKASGWFSNPLKVWKNNETNDQLHQNNHWFLREKNSHNQQQMRQDFQSMPAAPLINNNLGTLKDSGINDPSLDRTDLSRSSFGMILKDKFQRNPNMYFPATSSSSSSKKSQQKIQDDNDDDDNDDVIEDLELSDTDTLIHNMSEGSFDKESFEDGKRSSEEGSLSPHNSMEGSPRIRTHFTPSPGLSLGKKTIRNYTPKESSHMLKELEDRRSRQLLQNSKKTSVEKMIEDFHRNLPSSQQQQQQQPPGQSASSIQGTLCSQVSGEWSAASSSIASFDYQPVLVSRKSVSEIHLPSVVERTPPEGSENKLNDDDEDDFANLRKLISEGRIPGLHDKPPAFVPPPPPPPLTKNVKPNKPRKSREAPQPPPMASNTNNIKFVSSRLRESAEDLTSGPYRRKREVKRSASNHGTRTEYERKRKDNATAQLIADSTERKFSFNPFKGMWKKKHYSFDFN